MDHTSTTKFILLDGAKTISVNSFPEEAWTSLEEATSSSPVQKMYDSVGFLSRCVEIRANSLVALPWSIHKIGTKGEPLWKSTEEDPPDNLDFLQDLSDLLWLTEASLCLSSRAYWYKQGNLIGSKVNDLRWFMPGVMENVWDKKDGLVGFKRKLGQDILEYKPEEIVYFSLANPLHETKPRSSPVETALMDANVIFNLNAFIKHFFERGAIKATLLTVPTSATRDQREELKSWWVRFTSGIRKAWETVVISADVKPVVIGEGLKELENVNLTSEKRESIATTLGIPHSLILSNAANFATSNQDVANFYTQTIIPDAKLVAKTLNRQLLRPLGYYLKFNPEEHTVFQEDEQARASAVKSYVEAGFKLSVAAEILGVDLPDGMEYKDLDPKEPTQEQMDQAAQMQGQMPDDRNNLKPGKEEPESTGKTPKGEKEIAAESKKFKAWLKNRHGKVMIRLEDFQSDILDESTKAQLLDEFLGRSSQPKLTAKLAIELDAQNDESKRELRMPIERDYALKLENALLRQFDMLWSWLEEKMLPIDQKSIEVKEIPPEMMDELRERLGTGVEGASITPRSVASILREMLAESTALGVSVSEQELRLFQIETDWTLVHERALDEALDYTYELVRGLDETTIEFLQYSIGEWIESGNPLYQLEEALRAAFGRVRAEMIASTEVTRAYARGTLQGYRASGVMNEMEWRTANDEMVCTICGGLNATRSALEPVQFPDGHDIPPAHPRCRCWIAPVIELPPSDLAKGGPGSGNFGHAGRPGRRGGSAPGGGHRRLVESHGYRFRDEDNNPSGVGGRRINLAYQPADVVGVQNRIEDIFNRRSSTPLNRPMAKQLLQDLGEHGAPAIRIKHRILEKIVDGDGRLKSQFETGTSLGMLDIDFRAKAEERGLGVPRNVNPVERPIYGYLKYSRRNGDEDQYGNIDLKLKPEVKERATMTVGDSLGGMENRSTAGTPIHDPDIEGIASPRPVGDYQTGRLSRLDEVASSAGYIEIQIQKGVSLKDVEEVIDYDGKLPRATVRKLEGMGITVSNQWTYTSAKAFVDFINKGGPGSGNFGHAGRPGSRGGSKPGGGHRRLVESHGYQFRDENNNPPPPAKKVVKGEWKIRSVIGDQTIEKAKEFGIDFNTDIPYMMGLDMEDTVTVFDARIRSDRSLVVSAIYQTKDGEDLGNSTRSFRQQADGVWVHHDYLSLKPKLHGKGIAENLYARQMETYKEKGYTGVDIYANITVGKYAWAKAGFDYTSPGATTHYSAKFRTWAEDKGIPEPAGGWPAFTSARDVASYKHPARKINSSDVAFDSDIKPGDYDLGKAFMLDEGYWGHGSWEGYLRLK